FALNYSATATEDSCRKAVNDFVQAHFERYPVDSLDPRTIKISHSVAREFVRLASLIAQGRVEVEVVRVENNSREGSPSREEFVLGTPEGPERVILLLRTLALGLALVHSRTEVTDEDLEVLRHVAFSSLPRRRRQILRALLTNGGGLNTGEAE